MANYLSDRTGANIDSQLDKADTLLTPATGETLLHTGNISVLTFSNISPGGVPGVNINMGRDNQPLIETKSVGTITSQHYLFRNDNGVTGSIVIAGTATAFNTSSDPRLKEFAPTPTDESINTEFNKVFSCFRTFKWKADLGGDLVWGYDAHACIDAKIGMGSEGEGPRNLNIGDVYETTPAVTETRVLLDAKGLPTTDVETVITTPAIEKRVTPAGVDQSKVVAVLLAKIEQIERRLTAANI